jgi:hypothetical protein
MLLQFCYLSGSSSLRFLGGMAAINKQEQLCMYIEKHKDNEEQMLELAELIARDRRRSVDADDVPQFLEEWASSDTIASRGIYATQLKPVVCFRSKYCAAPLYA